MNKMFQVHKLNQQGIEKAIGIASHFNSLLANLEAICPEGREFSIAKTKLEEACFFAKKAMASAAANQEVAE